MNQPLPDLHDTGELYEPSTGWLVCQPCEGSGDIVVDGIVLDGMCPYCFGTGDPPMQPVTPSPEGNNAQT